MSPIKRAPLLLLFLLLGLSPLAANPFLGTPEGPAPARQPSRAVPAGLIEAQMAFREEIARIFTREEGPVLLPLLGFGFLYGLLHALGPGHRKTVVFSLFLARKTFPGEPFLAGFLSALLHGFSAVGLVLAYRTVAARLFLSRVDRASVYLEGSTYLLLAALALVLFIIEFRGGSHGKESTGKETGLYSTVAAASLFPCPAALMILTFSLTMDRLFLGILAVAALSSGMGLIVSAAGVAARLGREALFHRLKEKERAIGRIGRVLELGGYGFLLLFSLWMALPFLDNFI